MKRLEILLIPVRRSAIWGSVMLVLLVLFGTISPAACTYRKETRTATIYVGSSPTVKVTVGNGDVKLVVGTEGEILVTAKLKDPDKVDYEVSQEGDSVIVGAETKSGGRADVTLTVPENTEFELSTGSGNVDVSDLQASGQVHTGSGSITLEKITGDVVGNTGSGGITLSDVLGTFVLNTGNGAIAFRGELPPGSDNAFTTGSGSVTVELTGSPSVALDLETDDGEVKSDLPVTVEEISKGRLVGTIGDGEATLTVRVGSGDITIK